MKGTILSFRLTPVTLIVAIICALVAWITQLGQLPSPITQSLLISEVFGGLPEVRNGQWWRLLTPAVLHFSLAHIAFNLFLWIGIGAHLERIHGPAMMATLFIIVALVSNYAQWWVGSNPLFGGLSGVGYGVLGYLATMQWRFPRYPLQLPWAFYALPFGFMIAGWLGVLGYFGLNIANTAHTSGLIAGVVLALMMALWNRRR
ncbi:rhomboid family intramembrane serine protease [Gammaproteobacteria bacterium]|nr:rhomboid family intramembrane serine protease [Gammaproteobacteria bacterium]